MKSKWYCKILALCVVCSFIGIGIQSAFAVDINSSDVTISKDNELISVPVQFHKSNGVETQNLELNNQQVEGLDRIFAELQIDLLNCDSNLEVSEVYYRAIQSLYENGLFPDCFSVEEIQELFLGINILPRFQRVLSHLFSLIAENVVRNLFCFVSGESDDTRMMLGIIFYGGVEPYTGPYWAVGWVHTFGLFGEQFYSGGFKGGMGYFGGSWPDSEGWYKGGYGFRGLAFKPTDITYYIGIAKAIVVDSFNV